MVKVKKRDGSLQDFDSNKITNAIMKAMKTGGKVSKNEAQNISDEIYEKYKKLSYVDIKDIEISVFNYLVKHGYKNTAKSYEGYRAVREYQRNIDNESEKQIMSMLGNDDEYWKTENSNKNSELVTTKRDYMAGVMSKALSKKYIFTPDVVQADKEAIIKIHDLDYAIQHLTNCELINLEDMLNYGTNINGVHIDKPHMLTTATTIVTQIITAVTSSSYGGTTITLTHLAPFVRSSYNRFLDKYKNRGFNKEDCEKYAKEDLNKEIEDAVQTFNYQINSMSNVNGQSPFVSVFMYLNEDTEYTEEVAMLSEEFLKQRMQGMKNRDGHYITQAFPKLLSCLDENNIHEDSKYYYLTELAAKCTAKRMTPDYISAKIMKQLKGDVYPCIDKLVPLVCEN